MGQEDATGARSEGFLHATTSYVADARHGFVLDWSRSPSSDDQITLSVSASGLLESVKTQADDQPGVLLTKLVEAIAKARGPVDKEAGRSATGDKAPPPEVQMEIDPASDADIERVNRVLQTRTQPPGQAPWRIERVREFAPATLAAAAGYPPCAGVCYRPKLPYLIVLFDDKGDERDRLRVWLPNEAPILSAELTRAPFAEKTTTLTFSQGFLTKTDIHQKNQLEGFASIPVDILKAVFAIPSALFQFRVTRVNEDKGLVETRKELAAAQKELIEAQEALRKASQ